MEKNAIWNQLSSRDFSTENTWTGWRSDRVEVVADDFVVVEWGSTSKAAAQDHDKNLEALLIRCKDRGIKLNADKIKLMLCNVPFIGHIAIAEGLCADSAKVKAVTAMPPLHPRM